MTDRYAVRAEMVIGGYHQTGYVGVKTKTEDHSTYVSLGDAKLWIRRGAAEAFVKRHAGSLPRGARVATVGVED